MLRTIPLGAIALSALASTSLAAPLQQRDETPACTSMGKGPLGFNATSIGIYNVAPPGQYLTFNNTTTDRYGHNYLIAQSASEPVVPQFFELFQCLKTPAAYEGKGSIDVYQGYIQLSDGSCLARASIDSTEGHFSSEPCNYKLDGSSGTDQHFQFSLDSFYPYYSVVFLGTESGPTPAANDSFGSGGNYKLGLLDLPATETLPARRFVEADYQAGEEQNGSDRGNAMIAQLGSQYATPDKYMPTCKLIKTGSLSYKEGDGEAAPVSLSQNTCNDASNLVPVLNGTQTSSGVEFYECDSEYMGYTSDSTNHYGHMKTTEDRFDDDCFNRQYISGQGSTDVISSGNSSPYDACGTSDDVDQLRSFFHYNSDTGAVQFLGARADRFPDDVNYGWKKQTFPASFSDCTAATEVILSNSTTSNTLLLN